MSAGGGAARVVLPEGGALGLEPVEHDEPFQVAQPGAVQPRVQAAAARVLAEEEVALQLAPGHAVEGRQLRMVAFDARQPAEPVVVLRSGGVPVPRLEQADDVLAEVGPVAGGQAVVRDVGIERVMGRVGRGLGQIAGQDVVQGRDVRRALDAGMAAHRQDAAARTADVAEQELQDAPGTDHLRARGMLGPAQGVDEDARPLATGVGAEQLGDPRDLLRRAAAHLSNHLRGISGEVAFQDLEDATGVLQGRVACRLVVVVGRHLRSRRRVRPGPAIDGVAVDSLAVLRREPRHGGRIGRTLLARGRSDEPS